MAIHHARPGELIDLAKWPYDVEPGKSHTMIVADGLEVARLALPKGKALTDIVLPDSVTIHCVSGEIELTTTRARQVLIAGQLVYLPREDPHNLRALVDSVVLLTIGKS